MRLVDVEGLNVLQELKDNGYLLNDFATIEDAQAIIDELPTVDAEPVVHAQWISDPVGELPIFCDNGVLAHYKCSVCGRREVCGAKESPTEEFPYCHCGAKMDEGE